MITGIKVSTVIVRNGIETEYLADDRYYNFEYQNINYLRNPIVLGPVEYNPC